MNLEQVPSGLQTKRDGSKVAEHSGLLSVAAGMVGVLSYACTILLTNALNPADFSIFAASQMLLGMVGIVTSALVPLPLAHAVAANPQGSEGRRDAVAFAAMVSFLAGLVAAFITGLVAAGLGSPTIAAIVALSSLVLFVGAAPSGWLQGEFRFVRYTVKSVGEVLGRLLFCLLVVALSWGAPGAILGFAVGGLALLITPKSFYRDLTWRPRVLRQNWRWAETADIALALCVVSVLVGVDVVVVAFVDGGSTEAAGFQSLASIAKAPIYVAAGTMLVAFPLLRRPGVRINDVLVAALRSFGELALVAFAVIATAPHALVALVLPQRYHDSLTLLPWLALSGLGYATITVLATVLLALRAYRRCQLGLLLAALLIPSALLAGWYVNGVWGLAVGSAVGAVGAAIALAWISYPLLPPQSGRMAVGGVAAGTALTLVFVLADLLPVIWLIAVAGIGLIVLARQRGGHLARLDMTVCLRRVSVAPAAISRLVSRRRGLKSVAKSTEGAPKAQPRSEKPRADDADRSRRGYPNAEPGRLRGRGSTPALASGFMAPLTAFLACTGLAFGIRSIGLTQGFELWVDEMLYAQLGQSVSNGQLPRLPDGPFFLHPPGFFLLEGGVINVLGISGSMLDLVMNLRWLNAVLGAVSVGLAFLLVMRVGNRPAAWVTALVLSFEPFVLRSNSHLFLETLGMAAVLGGLLLVVTQLQRSTRSPRIVPLVIGGLSMGYGVLTKDVLAICTIAPVIAAVFWRRTMRLSDSMVLMGGIVVPYAIYLGIVASEGMFPDWLQAKINGAQRLIGLEKATGFTADGSPSLVSRLIDQAGHFGTSYMLLAICPVAAALLCFSARPERRLIGLASLGLGLLGLYSALFGTFEEQYGYGVMIAGVLSSTLLGVEMVERRPRLRRWIISFAASLVILSVVLGFRLEMTLDNGFAQVRQWVGHNLPADAKVSVTNTTGELLFADDERFGVWPTAPSMKQNGASYILTQSLPTRQGYGYARPAMLAWLETNARPLFSLQGPTNGATTLWFVDASHLEKGAMAGVGTPTPDETAP